MTIIIHNITPEMIPEIHQKALTVAKTAVTDYLADWTTKTGGNEYGEPILWVCLGRASRY